MTDPQKTNHWDVLASDLGADPPPPEEKPQQSEPEQQQGQPGPEAKTPPSGAAIRRAATTPKRERPASDWSSLADELGLERPEEPPKTLPPEADSVSMFESAAESQQPTAVPSEPEPEVPEVPKTKLASFELPELDVAPGTLAVEGELDNGPKESTRTELAPTDVESRPPSIRKEHEDSAGKRDEKTPGRKRRRRRPKIAKRLDEEPVEEAAEEPEKELASSGESDESVPVETSATDTESPERPKRRRRRRGSGKKKDAAKRDDEAAESDGSGEPAAAADCDEGDSLPPDADDIDEEGESRDKKRTDKGDASARAGHRSIPTWEEAIGVVISVNMESRAKRPSGSSSSRSRSGRGRGGRNKSGEKRPG